MALDMASDDELFDSSDEEEMLIAIPPLNIDPILDEEDDDGKNSYIQQQLQIIYKNI